MRLNTASIAAAEQLPTGSCVLKHLHTINPYTNFTQLPTGSCVLKLYCLNNLRQYLGQLPTGSCVLKLV